MNEENIKPTTHTEAEYQDLANDFEFIKDLNREMAEKYADLLTAFPTSKEVQLIMDIYEGMHVEQDTYNTLTEGYDSETINKRKFQLKRLKSACLALERNDPAAKPPKYEDLEK